MLSDARRLILHLLLQGPHEIMVGVVVFSVVGLVAGTGISSLVRRRREGGALAAESFPAALVLMLFCLADWLLLWSLPHLRLSFAPEITLPLVVTLLVRLIVFLGLLGPALLARWRGRLQGVDVRVRSAAVLFLVVNLSLSGVQMDAYVVEPLLVETTDLELVSSDLDPLAPPVRIVHLTDVHIERSSYREAAIVRKVNALEPDIIVITGDFVNLSYLSDPVPVAHVRQFMAQLQAPYGVYAVRGTVENTPESMARLVEGTGVVWLEQEAVTVSVRGQPVTLVGVACSHQHKLDTARLAQAVDGVPADGFRLLLYHSPDLIYEAAEHGIDLYLGGHTHGGQICLPFYGALVTGSMYGRRYTSGLFEEGDTKMYISRGLGFEGGGMPRARFLCRPEIVSIELTGRE